MVSRRRVFAHTLASAVTSLGMPAAGRANVVQSSPGRIALVIGNERYRQNPLRSAVNDARAVAALLTSAGFAVDLKLNASLEEMTTAIDTLGTTVAVRDIGTSVFYYAGHAAQLEWRNYLLPIDADVESLGDIRKQCVDLGRVLGRLGRAKGRTALIFLDACRDDPFGKRLRAPLKGMSQYDAPAGTLLAFATAPGRVAIEPRRGSNGLYTEHLVRELSVKGVRIEDALKRVRLNVRLASRGAQVPWESTSLEHDIYLYSVPSLSESQLERQLREELELWSRIKNSKAIEDWAAYLRRFPNGKFAEVAQIRLARLTNSETAIARPPVAVPSTVVRLGPDQGVPARFKASDNPNSAGTYLFRPQWSVDDYYDFQELDLYSSVVQRTYRMRVRKVDTSNDRVELADGSLLNLMGWTLRQGSKRHFDIPIQINPSELQVGRNWVSRFQQSGDAVVEGEYNFRIVERQKVKVPAGEFFAFRIDGDGWMRGPRVRNTRLQVSRWMVPGINFPVRQENRQAGSARVLVTARQAMTR